MTALTATLDGVIEILVEVLGIKDRVSSLNESTPLFGSLPELDSLAVLELITALEERYGFEVNDADFTGEIFETVGTLAAFVDEQRQSL
jgi:acyl carrier protein